MNSHLTLAEIAMRLQLSVRTVQYMNQAGLGPKSIRVGRAYRVSHEEFEKWISELPTNQS